ncbi:MAG TPA: sodium:solute symporter, partial [Vicingus sp.]|nr:sodium:solute symporter [Vicingus sp.]
FIKGNAVFYGAILAELCVVYIHYLNENAIAPSFLTMGFLWYNIVGCGLVVLFGLLLQLGLGKKKV